MKLNLKELWQTVLVLAILAASIANVMLKAYAKSQLPLDSALRTDANGRSYNRTQYLKQRFEQIQLWADYLDKLAAGGDVIQFKAA